MQENRPSGGNQELNFGHVGFFGFCTSSKKRSEKLDT